MRIAVVLSGCGYLDGAEIRESVLTLLYLDKRGASVSCFAPDIPQADVVNHLTGAPKEDFRSVLEESARIARGQIKALDALNPADFDGLMLPGGYGAAKNLSDFAVKGAQCSVLAQLEAVIQAFYAASKPIAAVCIAPILLAASLKGKGLTLTIGEDAGVASAIEALGHTHAPTPTDAACIDAQNRIVTCSAYMREDALYRVAQGIEHVANALLDMIEKQLLSKAS